MPSSACGLNGARAEHIDRAVGRAGKANAVSQQAAGRRIENDVVRLRAQEIDDAENFPDRCLPRFLARRISGKEPERAALHGGKQGRALRGIVQRGGVDQALRRLPNAERRLDRRTPQVGVHQNDARTLAGQRQRQIDGDGRLALSGHGARYEQDLPIRPGQRPKNLGAERADALLIGGGDLIIVDGKQAGILFSRCGGS